MEGNSCKHFLSLPSRATAYRGAAKRCELCGDVVYLRTAVFDTGVHFLILPIVGALIAAFSNGGFYWLFVLLAIASLGILYAVDVSTAKLIAYDHGRHKRWQRVGLGLFSVVLVAIGIWWYAT